MKLTVTLKPKNGEFIFSWSAPTSVPLEQRIKKHLNACLAERPITMDPTGVAYIQHLANLKLHEMILVGEIQESTHDPVGWMWAPRGISGVWL